MWYFSTALVIYVTTLTGDIVNVTEVLLAATRSKQALLYQSKI